MVDVGETDWLPEVAVDDVQPLGEAAVHEVAFVLDQVNLDELPAVIEAGDTDNVTVGAGTVDATL